MSFGDVDAYNKTYEQFLRTVRAAGNVEPDWVPPSAKFEYKWDVPESANGTANGSASAFGPFSEEEMRAWFDASYFGPSGEKVKVRPVGGEWGDWEGVFD